ncbi:MAG: type II secretion system protein [Tissierellia bacterium]|nr:type II secretion system protein [Tissierellia bacterium]
MKKRGFSLIEIIIVIALLSLIVSISIPPISNTLRQSTKTKSLIKHEQVLCNICEMKLSKQYTEAEIEDYAEINGCYVEYENIGIWLRIKLINRNNKEELSHEIYP